MTLTPILNTKLYKHDVKSTYVIRKRIIDYLENNRSNRLSLVIAATGYGKSVNETDKNITTSIRVKIKDQAELSAVMNTLYEWRYTILLVKCEGSTLNS